MKERGQGGFTLIELLVVIAILAILSGVAVPRVLDAITRANTNTNTSNTAIIQSAVERYWVEHNEAYPVTLHATQYVALGTGLVPNYLKEMPAIRAGATGVWCLSPTGMVVIATAGATAP